MITPTTPTLGGQHTLTFPSGLCERCMMPSYSNPCRRCKASEATPPTSLRDVTCRALTEPLMGQTPTPDNLGLKLRWTGKLTSKERASILSYMQRVGAWITHYPATNSALYHSDNLDISVVLLPNGRNCSIAAWDRSEPKRSPHSPLLVIDGGAA